jgi:hypothetical protein
MDKKIAVRAVPSKIGSPKAATSAQETEEDPFGTDSTGAADDPFGDDPTDTTAPSGGPRRIVSRAASSNSTSASSTSKTVPTALPARPTAVPARAVTGATQAAKPAVTKPPIGAKGTDVHRPAVSEVPTSGVPLEEGLKMGLKGSQMFGEQPTTQTDEDDDWDDDPTPSTSGPSSTQSSEGKSSSSATPGPTRAVPARPAVPAKPKAATPASPRGEDMPLIQGGGSAPGGGKGLRAVPPKKAGQPKLALAMKLDTPLESVEDARAYLELTHIPWAELSDVQKYTRNIASQMVLEERETRINMIRALATDGEVLDDDVERVSVQIAPKPRPEIGGPTSPASRPSAGSHVQFDADAGGLVAKDEIVVEGVQTGGPSLDELKREKYKDASLKTKERVGLAGDVSREVKAGLGDKHMAMMAQCERKGEDTNKQEWVCNAPRHQHIKASEKCYKPDCPCQGRCGKYVGPPMPEEVAQETASIVTADDLRPTGEEETLDTTGEIVEDAEPMFRRPNMKPEDPGVPQSEVDAAYLRLTNDANRKQFVENAYPGYVPPEVRAARAASQAQTQTPEVVADTPTSAQTDDDIFGTGPDSTETGGVEAVEPVAQAAQVVSDTGEFDLNGFLCYTKQFELIIGKHGDDPNSTEYWPKPAQQDMTPNAATRRSKMMKRIIDFFDKARRVKQDGVPIKERPMRTDLVQDSESYRVVLAALDLSEALEAYATNDDIEQETPLSKSVESMALAYLNAHKPLPPNAGGGPALDPNFSQYLDYCDTFQVDVGTMLHELANGTGEGQPSA